MFLLTVISLPSFVSVALACNGFEARDFRIEECYGKSDLISFEKVNAILRDDCSVVMKGCVTLKKQINWGNATYNVERKGMPFKFAGQKDLCLAIKDSKKYPQATLILQKYKVEQDCPLKSVKLCGDETKSMSVAKYKERLNMFQGNYEAIMEGTSNAGSFCIKIRVSIVPKVGWWVPQAFLP